MSFARYPAYKDSGVDWLGEVPAHWEVHRLKRSAQLLTEKTDRRTNPVALENIESWSGRFVPTDTEFAGDGVAFQHGDILFGKLRPYLAKALLAQNEGEAVGDFHVMRPQEGAIPRFLQYQLLEQAFIDIVDGSTFGSKMPRASWEFVGTMPLPAPPPSEQTAIATFLDRETAKIDALVAEQERLIALLKEKRQAVISQAVTKGLDPSVPMKDSGVEWLGEVPAHWEVTQFRRHVFIAQGQVDPEKEPYKQMVLIAPNHIEGGTGRLIVLETAAEQGAESGKYLCEVGDVIYSKIRPALRKVCIAPERCLCSADMYPLRPDSTLLNQFLAWFVLSEQFSSLAVLESERVAMPKINRETLNEVWLVLPSLCDQEEICGYLNTETAALDDLIGECQKSILHLQERRSALISAAVTGQIDVRCTPEQAP